MATLDEKMALREALMDLGYTRTKGGLIIEALKHEDPVAYYCEREKPDYMPPELEAYNKYNRLIADYRFWLGQMGADVDPFSATGEDLSWLPEHDRKCEEKARERLREAEEIQDMAWKWHAAQPGPTMYMFDAREQLRKYEHR